MIMTQKDDKVTHTLGFVLKESIDLAGCPIVCNDIEALVVHVEDQVLALTTPMSKKL